MSAPSPQPPVPRQRLSEAPRSPGAPSGHSRTRARHPSGRLRAVYSPEEAGALRDIDRAHSTTRDTADEIWAEAETARERLVGWLRFAFLSLAFVGYLAYLLIGGRP